MAKKVKKEKEEKAEKAEKLRISKERAKEKPKELKPGELQLKAVKSYCDAVLDKYKKIIKAIWLITPKEFEAAKTLTVIILLNDVQPIDHITKRDVETVALAAEGEVKKSHGIEVNSSFYLLSEYWDMIRHGSPITFSEIRHGLPVYDPAGFFVPLKKLLEEGRIPCTKEAMRALIAKAPLRVKRVKFLFKVTALEHIEAAVIDAAQAPLIVLGVAPPAPKHTSDALRTHLVNKGLLEPEYIRYCDDVHKYWKAVVHGKIQEIPGKKLDELIDKGMRFVARMEDLLGEIELAREQERLKEIKSAKEVKAQK